MTLAWIYIVLAGICEVAWAVALKYSENWTRLWPSIAAVIGMIASIAFLALAMRTLGLGISYSVWTGIGAVGTVFCGVWLFSEPLPPTKLACVTLIVLGIIGLKLSS